MTETESQITNNYLNKNPTLTSNENAFTLTFDSTLCPILALDFEDAEQFSINCITAEKVHLVKVFSSEKIGESRIQSKDSVVTFECRCFETDLKTFKLEFEVVSEKESLTEVIGIFEFDFKKIADNSQGRLKLDIKNGSTVCGKIACSYLHVKPFLAGGCLQKSHDYWRGEKQLRGGHRGSGNSFTGNVLSDVRENTIDSFRAAFDQGKADFVEFDVTITRDHVPVVYHDLGLAIDRSATTINRQTSTALHDACKTSPTSVQHLSEIDGRAGDLQFEVSKPWEMPDLAEMFSDLPVELGFNLEVKWPTVNVEMKSENMLGQDAEWFDMNEYVDHILKVVMQGSVESERELIFSCFDPNVCYCLQLKQSKYPVMQLTTGDSKHYTDLIDLRIRRNSTAVKWAAHVGYLAINTLVKDVLDGYDLVDKTHDAGLKLFVYGDDMQNPEVLKRLKTSQLDALVYDVIHQVQ